MRRVILWQLLALVALAAAAPASQAPPRAMWVWEEPEAGQLRFARQRGVGRLYLHVKPGAADDEAFRSFARQAQRRGVELWATGGAPEWSMDPGRVGRWAREVASSGVFAGIVVDIEPYTLDDWDEARGSLTESYLRGLARGRRAARGLPFLAAVPFWFDREASGNGVATLLEATLQRTDGIVVMAYRDHADGKDGILYHLVEELAAAEAMGKPVVVAVHTARSALDKITFFEEGDEALERELAKVTAALADHPAFAGVALHDYAAYRRLHP